MRYSVMQIDVPASSSRRENIGLVAEDTLGRLREITVAGNSLAAELALGGSTFRSLGKNIENWYQSGDWKQTSPKSFLEFLSNSKLLNLRFSPPEPVPDIGGALNLLYRGRVSRELKQAARFPQRIVSARGLNLVLLAYFLARVESVDKLRLQKSLYMAELSQDSRGWSGLKYGFFRYLHGPFSREIYAHLDSLEAEGLVIREGFRIGITDAGKAFVVEALPLLRDYPMAVSILEETVGEWQNRSTRDLVNAAYATAPMQQSTISDDLLPLVPEERFSWVPTSASPALVTKIETIVLCKQKMPSPQVG